MSKNNLIKIGVQKSGRIKEEALAYLQENGISFDPMGRKLSTNDTENQMQLLLLRSTDIIRALEDNKIDIGIYGKDTWLETNNHDLRYKNLNFSKCRMSIAVPGDLPYQDLYDLQGKTIATSYPNILKMKLAKKDINARILTMDGGVEIAPGLGWADAIFDIVGTGQTLKDNDLSEKETLFESNAIIVTRDSYYVPEIPALEKMLLSRTALSQRYKKPKPYENETPYRQSFDPGYRIFN